TKAGTAACATASGDTKFGESVIHVTTIATDSSGGITYGIAKESGKSETLTVLLIGFGVTTPPETYGPQIVPSTGMLKFFSSITVIAYGKLLTSDMPLTPSRTSMSPVARL